MRRAAAALTVRGRILLGVGVALLAVSFGLGDRDVARAGVLLIVLPIISAITVASARARVGSERWLTAARVSAGEAVDVRIRVTNGSRVPTGVLLAEDTLPAVFGGRPRFVIDRLRGEAKVEVRYPVRCELRGRYRLGPLTVRLRDPFGLSQLIRAFDDTDQIVVTPAVQPLPPVRLTGEWAGLGESTRRSVASAGEDDASVREYRLGDDLRRVHWRSTAHRDELMVRREEQPWQSRAALLLDTRVTGHHGEGAASSLEWAISAVASIGVHLDDRGFQVRLVFDSGVAISGETVGGRFSDVMLESLATCGPSRAAGLSPGLAALRHGGGEGLVVAVLGACDEDDIQAMIRSRSAGVAGVAVLLDSPSWRPGPRRDGYDVTRAARLLTVGGWRVAVASRGADLATLWLQVGHRIEAQAHPESLEVAATGGATA